MFRLQRLTACVSLFVFALPVPGQELLWVKQLGTAAEESALTVASDGADGTFVGGLAFGELFPTSVGHRDAWLARLDAAGGTVWAKQFGTPTLDSLAFAVTDDAGGVWVTGSTLGALGGPNNGGGDVWFGRFDANGNTIWMDQFGTPEGDSVIGATRDGAGGFFLCGTTGGWLGGPNAGANDAWLGHWTASGTPDWVLQMGTPATDGAYSVVSDGNGGVFVGGETAGDLAAMNKGGYDIWVAHVDANHNIQWTRQFGTDESETVHGLAISGGGGVIAGGWTTGGLFGPALGDEDAILLALDAAGNVVWTKQFGSVESDFLAEIVQDSFGGFTIAGTSQGNLSGSGTTNPTYSDAWVARLAPSGETLWLTEIGSTHIDGTNNVTALPGGDVVAVGRTYGSFGAPYAGDGDAWIARLSGTCSSGKAYCTSSATSIAGCTAQLTGTGTPSLSSAQSFRIDSSPVPGGNIGIAIFSTQGPGSIPLGTLGGFVCLNSPVLRASPKFGGGSVGLCNGAYSYTLQDLETAQPVLQAGTKVSVQLWARDPANVDGFLLSSGWAFTICP